MRAVALRVRNDLHTRGRTYKHFSEALAYPEDEAVFSELMLQLAEDMNYSSFHSDNLEPQRSESCFNFPIEIQKLAREYTRLFRGPVKSQIYPYESMYMEGEIFGEATQDVIKRYAEAGLRISPDFKDLPDHICAELEFMYFLCAGEERALHRNVDEESSRLRVLQKEFFERHLGRWAPQFCLSLAERTAEHYFKLISHLMADFLDSEKGYFDVVPAPLMPVT